MFKITSGKGFYITFKNGVTVSVQFGWGSYCGNYPNDVLESPGFLRGEPDKKATEGCPDAEVAIWDKDERWITREYKDDGDDVIGYCSPEKVLDILNWAAAYKKKRKKEERAV